MNRYGRIVICGSIASYDGDAAPDPGVSPRTLINVFMARFLVLNFFDEYEAAVDVLKIWTQAGRIKVREEVIEGLENAPEALIGLLAGRNIGKRMVRVA
jgi:NADPH-dependent curcumin reductase CurA